MVMRMTRTSAPTRARLFAAFVVAAGLGILVWQATASPAESTAGTTAESTAETTDATGSPAESYSIFARPADQRDDFSHWARLGGSRIGARLSEGRFVDQDATRTVAAVPAAKAPCLMSRYADGSYGASCGGAGDQHPATVSYSGAIGLVPDAVESVTFTMTDGTSRVTRVTDNTWKSPVEAAKASYSIDGRVFEVDLMPRSSLPAGATIDPTTGVVSGGTPRNEGVG